MFKLKKKRRPAPNESILQLVNAVKVTREFFPDAKQLDAAEHLDDIAARELGITREAFNETCRYIRSLGAGRVIPRGE